MASILYYYCPKCNFNMKAKEGNGFHYPKLYQSIKNKMINGELGAEAKHFFEEHSDGAISVEYTLAQCNDCNELENVLDLTMYIPKPGYVHEINPHQAWSTAAPYYNADYVSPFDLKSNYTQYKLFHHICRCCGGMMTVSQPIKYSYEPNPKGKGVEEIIKHLESKYYEQFKCPKCSNTLTVVEIGNWD